jgi:hypothetical protein
MLSFLSSRVGKLLIALVAAAGIILGAMQWGAGREREAVKVEKLETFIETSEVISNVKITTTPDAAVERLRNNGWVR